MISEHLADRELSITEINARLPRKVKLYADERPKLFIVTAVILATVAIWFGCFHYYVIQVKQRNLLQSQGRDFTAQVIKLLSSKGGTYVRYTFRIGSIWYVGEAKLPNDPRVEATVGQPIPIRYVPSDPSVNHPNVWAWSLGWDVVPILYFLVFSGIGFIAAIVTVAGLLRERTLMGRGLVAEGKVTACAPNRSKFSIDYEFRTADNRVVMGSNEYSADEYEVGAQIRIVYLRNRPQTNEVYPLSSFQVADQHD